MNPAKNSNRKLVPIIAASSVGTLIEWYDFFIFGSLATIISTEFFPKENPAAAFLATLATFSAGFIVRPFGAIVFGKMGDMIGRKYTFMITLILMGGSTIGIGLVPTYSSIGFFAPFIVLILRLLQGLAIGGEYGGAATYIAEQSPIKKRGLYTSWIQATTGMAFILSITVILIIKHFMIPAAWESWGWRLPFLLSILLVGISVYIRRKMSESPLFAKAKAEGKTSLNPLKESFARKENLKMVLLAFFSLTLGGGTLAWIGFYAQSFILKTLNVDYGQANTIIIVGILLGIPFFFFFGWLSDKIGRKNILLAGLLLGILGCRPIFSGMYHTVDLQQKIENTTAIKINNESEQEPDGKTLITTTSQHFFTDGTILKEVSRKLTTADSRKSTSLKTITLNNTDKWKLIFLVFLLEFIFTVSYGPLAAFLVEMFPLKIRYTSLSLPYHFGYGIIGGMAPYFASYFVEKASEANKPDYYLAGLSYPLIMMSISIIIGIIYLKENKTESNVQISLSSKTDPLKKWLGLLWIALGMIAAWFGIFEMGIPKITSGMQEDIVFGIIMMLIITPIVVVGLFLFGKYCLQGEYDNNLLLANNVNEESAF
ncbi:MAG: MFS transporter [Ginsengibacter sp.]